MPAPERVPSVLSMTIVLIGLLHQDPVVAELIRRLGSEQAAERDAATAQIKRLGPAAEPALREAAQNPDPEVAARIRHLLRFIEVGRKVPARLLDRLPVLADRLAGNDPHAWTRVFLDIAADPAKAAVLRRADLDALAIPALSGAANQRERHQVFDVIRRRRLLSAVPALVELLSEPSEVVYGNITYGLQSMGITIEEPKLALLLAHDRQNVRSAAERILGQAAHVSLIPRIVELLKDLRAEVRASVLRVLSTLNAAGAAEAVAACLSDPEAAVRAAAARALGPVAGYRFAAGLEPLVREADPAVASAAIESAGTLRFRRLAPAIKAMLGDARPAVRRAAVTAIARLDGSRALAPLRELLDDPDAGVRAAVVQSLVGIADADVVGRLEEALEDSDRQVRGAAIRILGKVGGSGSVPRLEEALEDSDVSVRYYALQALGELKVPEATPPLLNFIEQNRREYHQAVYSLQHLYFSPESAGTLTKLLEHEEPYVRSTAASTMILRFPVDALVGHQDEGVRGVVLAHLYRLDPPRREKVLADALKDPSAVIRKLALGAVAEGPGEPVPALSAALKDPDEGVRSVAVGLLAGLEVREAGDAVLALIGDPASGPRSAALQAAGRLKLEAARAPVLKALEEIRGPEYVAAAEAAGLLGVPEAVPLLKAGVEEGQGPACLAAAGALARLGIPEGVTELLALMEEETLADGCLTRLMEDGGPQIALKIAERLERLDRHVAERAIGLLGGAGVPEAAPAILAYWENHPTASWTAAHALANLGSRDAVPKVVEMLKLRGPAVQTYAAGVLKDRDAREAIPALLEMVAGEDPSAAAAALHCLGTMRAAEAEARAIALLESPDEQLGAAALTALGQMGGDASVEPVLKRLNHPAPALRAAAAEAAGRLGVRLAADRLVGLLEDPSREVRISASAALVPLGDLRVVPFLQEQLKYGDLTAALSLCRLGNADGIDLMLANAWASASFAFNRPAAPEVWRRLAAVPLKEDLVGTRAEVLRQVAQAAGLGLEALPSKGRTRIRVAARAGRESLLGALEAATEGEWVILGPDQIRVVTYRDGLRHWRRWRAGR